MIITKEFIRGLLGENDWESIEVECPNGTTAIVIPCSEFSYRCRINEMTLSFFVIKWDIPYCTAYNIDQLVYILNNHKRYVGRDSTREIFSELQAKIQSNTATQEEKDIYSDIKRSMNW